MNRHFGKLADVWKHLVLAELLTREPPNWYAETHAGSASYQLIDDAERRFGVRRFLELTDPPLAHSAYRQRIEPLTKAGRYPGSAALAMLSLPRNTSYLLCDLDPSSAADLRSWAAAEELTSCEVVERDGMAATIEWIEQLPRTDGLVVHIDPFDPHARSDRGYSAVELAIELVRRDHGCVLVRVRRAGSAMLAVPGDARCVVRRRDGGGRRRRRIPWGPRRRDHGGYGMRHAARTRAANDDRGV